MGVKSWIIGVICCSIHSTHPLSDDNVKPKGRKKRRDKARPAANPPNNSATSMIGFIALAGIEVRSSILLVDFVKNEVHLGQDAMHAVANAGQIRMRPIWVTNLTMMAGAATILFDPIFQGMAISLLFGPIVATTLTLFVIPLGCTSVHKTLCPSGKENEDGSCLIPGMLQEEMVETECYQQLKKAIVEDETVTPTIGAVMKFEFEGKSLTREEAKTFLDQMVVDGLLERDSRNWYQIVS